MAASLLLFVVGLLCLAQQSSSAFWQSRDSNYNKSITTVAGGSAWGDSGTNIVKSTTVIANDTATGGIGAAASWSSVRGTQAYSTGKHCFDVKMISAPTIANFIVGIMDNATANGAPMDDRALVNSGGQTQFNGTANANGSGFSANNLSDGGWALSNNDIMGICADHDNGFWYMSLTPVATGVTTYFKVGGITGDPTSGALGTGSAGNGGMAGARPMLSLFGTGNGIVQLITTGLTTPLPAGYSNWNFLLKRDLDPANDNTPVYVNVAA